MSSNPKTQQPSVKELLYTLSALSQSANMVSDNAPIIKQMELTQNEIIKRINKERRAEKRALPISEAATKHYYKDGHAYYKVCAKGCQIKRSSFMDFLIELCKLYFPKENISITIGKRRNTPTVLSVGTKYIEYIQQMADNEEISWGTCSHKQSKWNTYIKGSDFAGQPIEKVTYPDIKNFYRSITAGRAIKRENLRGVKTVINGIFDYALNDLGLDVVDPRRVDTNSLKIRGKQEAKRISH